MTRAEILVALDKERLRQAEKWNREHEWGYGDCSIPSGQVGALGPHGDYDQAKQYADLIKASVLAEEAGEALKAALNVDEAAFRTEVIQTLAVAWAILEGIPS
jgi:hypothetical protein